MQLVRACCPSGRLMQIQGTALKCVQENLCCLHLHAVCTTAYVDPPLDVKSTYAWPIAHVASNKRPSVSHGTCCASPLPAALHYSFSSQHGRILAMPRQDLSANASPGASTRAAEPLAAAWSHPRPQLLPSSSCPRALLCQKPGISLGLSCARQWLRLAAATGSGCQCQRLSSAQLRCFAQRGFAPPPKSGKRTLTVTGGAHHAHGPPGAGPADKATVNSLDTSNRLCCRTSLVMS